LDIPHSPFSKGLSNHFVPRGTALLASGWLLGTLLILLMGRFIERLLFDVRPTDSTVLAAVTLLLCGVAGPGSLLPAMRAARLNPSSALRQ